jgi:erythronolide synthase
MFDNLPLRADAPVLPWVISASSEAELAARARSLLPALDEAGEATAAEVGAALAAADRGDTHRAVVCGGTRAELRAGLAALADGLPHAEVIRGVATGPASVAFVYPGQGAQWPGMTLDLIAESPVFRDAMTATAEAFASFGGPDLESFLRREGDAPELRRPDLVQPALFAIEASLSTLWASFGVRPAAVVGHSMGDVAAAYVGGGVTLPDASRVIALWSREMVPLLGRGDMASVAISAEEAERRRLTWQDDLVVAGILGPRSVLLAGTPETVTRRVAELTAEGVTARVIDVGMAAHGPQTQSVYDPIVAALDWFTPGSGEVPFYSSLTGGRLDTRELGGRYWAENFRNPVRFETSVSSCLADGADVVIEVSPHPVLVAGAEQTVDAHGGGIPVLHTLRRRHGGMRRFTQALAQAYAAGVAVDWTAAFGSVPGNGFRLPATAEPVAVPSPRPRDLERLVVAEATAVLGRSERIDPGTAFLDAGFDSALAVELINRLRSTVDRKISVTAIYAHPTPRDLAAALTESEVPEEIGPVSTSEDDPIVVVGMACRLAGGVRNPDELWELLAAGGDAIGPLPDDRGWDLASLTHPDGSRPGTSTQRAGGFLAEATRFDPGFFRMSPREALATDPQQRLLLEVAWEALEHARIPPPAVKGSRTGVFAGVIGQEYGPRLADGTDGHLFTGTTPSVASGRLAYTLGLEGPALSIDTACSSSLVAILLAARSLASGETNLALAGGVTVMPGTGMLVDFSRQGALAPDGRCKAFSADADGFSLAEGAGMLVLERLSDARRHGHRVLAVLRGGAMNQDGASNGLSAPNGRAQRQVIEQALASSGLRPSDVDAVEAHGTGTRLGDPIEAEALIAAYGDGREDSPLWLGSVKSNVGHAQAAAGVTGVIKMILALRHEELPRTLHVTEPSREVAWDGSGLRLLTGPVPWPRAESPRRAGVSSFGISGTNAHVLLEEAPEAADEESGVDRSVPWVLTGVGHDGLRGQASRLAEYLRERPGTRLLDMGLSLATTRAALSHRTVLVPRDHADAVRLLDELASGVAAEPVRDVGRGGLEPVFVFPGQGWQWAGMGVELLDSSPEFARAMADCDRALAPHTGFSVIEELRAQRGEPDDRVDRVQPVLFAMMVSLAALWRAHGIRPAAVIGHSQGEIAAACVAGALSLDEAGRLVALRCGLLAGLRGRCGMAAVALSTEDVSPLPGGLVVAAVNGPRSVVLAGPNEELDAFLARCADRGVRASRLPVDYASHSPQIAEIRDELARGLGRVEAGAATVPFFSTVHTGWLDGAQLDVRYWYDNLRERVEFAPSIQALAAEGHRVFLEISAHPVLTAAIEESAPDVVPLGTLRRDDGDSPAFHASLARVHASGVDVADWGELYAGARVVDLPTYAFQRQRFWLEPGDAATVPQDPLRYHIEWRAQDLEPSTLSGPWLLVRRPEDHPLVAAARTALTEAGAEVRELVFDGAFGALGTGYAGVLSLLAVDDPAPNANLALFQSLLSQGLDSPLWCVTVHAVSATPGEPVPEPAAAGIWGLGRVAALEHPDRWGGLIDVPADGADDLAAHLAAVLADRDVPEDEVALRGGRVLARRWVRPGPSVDLAQWTPTGTALVTGGTGGIGRHVVRWLAELGAPHILVASRSGPDASGADALVSEVEARGSAITVASCDVADRDDLARLLDSIDQKHPLTAVFHTAATLDDALIEHLDPARLDNASRSKVLGARNLHELTSGLDLSAFVLFSSFAAAFGAPGLGSYAPGNAYLDALARTRRAEGLVATSVGWGTWADSGMAEGPVGERFRRHGVLDMVPDQALRALRGAIVRAETCPVIIDISWDRFLEAFTAQRRTHLFDELPEARRTTSAQRTSPLAGLPQAERDRALTDLVRRNVAEVLGHDDPERVPAGRAFRDLGFDSLASVELRNRLSAATGLHLPPTVVFDHPDVTALSTHLATLFGPAESTVDSGTAPADEPIAIVGMACRFPGGISGPEQLWEFVLAEGDATGAVPEDRGWNLADLSTGDAAGSFLDDAAEFDAAFFGVSPREALAMDPQQRLALESTWDLLERAGIRPDTLRGSDTGVFLGMSHHGYGSTVDPEDEVDGYRVTGNTASVASGRIAYVLGLEGPAMTVDTACSSSLVALHLACGALRAGECSLAVAGGVTVMAGPEVYTEFTRQGALAPDGRCKPYAADADGFGLSEGVALVLVERLSEARRRGHRVLGVVAGSAVNSDGASNGLTAPNGRAQERVIRQAWRRAGLSGAEVDVVEGHGTGTRLGDPVEVSALLATYGRARNGSGPVALGSVKSNIGHTQAAAGVAGVIKMVSALRHGTVPGSRCAGGVSELVEWSGVDVATEARPWRTGQVRRAGVSAFGVSGTNAHVILEEAPPAADDPVTPGILTGVWPVLLSARTPSALRAQSRRLADYLAEHPDTSPRDVYWTLAHTRQSFEHRSATVDGEQVTGAARDGRRIVFVFPGQGSQWVGMALELLDEVPVFAESMAECDAAVSAVAGFSVLSVLRGEPDAPPWDRVDVVQPVLFAVMVSLARLWQACGVTPSAVVGHSQGEIAAACVSGALSLPDAARVVALRSRALRALSGKGTMLHVPLSRVAVTELAGEDVEIAAVNGPSSVVVAGDNAAVARIEARCAEQGVRARRIQVDYASHTAHVEEVRAEFADTVGTIAARPGQVPLYSTSAGSFVDGSTLDAGHWYANLRGTVEFDAAIRALLASGHDTFIEISPHPVLGSSMQDIAADVGADHAVVLDTLRRDDGGPSRFLAALAEAHVHGTEVDWAAACGTGRHVDLPGYPFERQRFWLRPGRGKARDEIEDWFYDVTWTRLAEPPAPALEGDWVVVASDTVSLDPLLAELAARGATPRVVSSAEEIGDTPAGVISLLGMDGEHTAAVLPVVRALGTGLKAPLWMVSSGAVSTGPGDPVRCPSPLWGLGMTAALERGPIWTGLVDLPAAPDSRAWARLVAALGGAEDQLAIRADGLRARRLRRRHRPAPSRAVPVLPEHGTILVTGGTSGLGAAVARWLADQGARRLALVSRSGSTAGDLVADLESRGARVSVHACDVTDRESVRELVHGLGDPVTGVVHAAGLPQRTSIVDMSEPEYERVLAPKVLGARNLHESCVDAELFVLFSSGAGVWGSGDQGGYAAGNAFLDSFARHRSSLGLPATSVAWGLWASGGMTGDAEAVARLHDLGMSAMPEEHALEALGRVLAHGDTTAVVADIAWPVFVEGFAAARERPLLADLPEARTRELAPDPSWAQRIAALPTAARRAELVRLVTTQAAAVLGRDDPGAITVSTPFRSLGFDSLAAVRFRNRVNEITGLRLGSTVVFDHPTAAELAEFLDSELAAPEAVPDVDTAIRVIESALTGLPGQARSDLLTRLGRLVSPAGPEESDDDSLREAGVDELLEALSRELDGGTAP